MKTDLSLQELAAELTRQKEAKRDYIVPSERLRFDLDPDLEPRLKLEGVAAGVHGMRIRHVAHRQFAERTGVPVRYYDRMMAEAPDLLCANLNHWLERDPAPRLLRTMDGEARALLSDRYRPLDNFEFAEAILPALRDLNAEVRSCSIGEDKMWLKVVRPELRAEILPPGAEMGKGHDRVDIVEAGIVLSNSEVGAGALSVQPAIHTTGCTNLAIMRENRMHRTHLGRALGGGDEGIRQYLSDETRRQGDLAVWLAVRDVAQKALDGTIFWEQVERLRAARTDLLPVGEKAVEAVKEVTAHFGLSESEGSGVLGHLMNGGDLTRYGVSAAITRMSQDCEGYGRATALEEIGGKVIDLSPREWRDAAKLPAAGQAS